MIRGQLKDQMMKKIRIVPSMLALAGWFAVSVSARAQFAGSVLSYDSGTGFAAGFTNTSSALGAPALGSKVTPFAPPSSKSQLLSIGAGGEVTLQMDTPILNNPADPFGLNFIVFANSFFVQNGGSGQTATTSGALFFHAASTLVQVSPDDLNWYTLNPVLAPQPGQWFPTYGAGDPQLPVDPALANVNFAGMTLGQVESLYGGSAGGTGFSLSWAQDSGGNNVDLASADYVRIEVQSGVLDMDAISAIPEPGVWELFLTAGAIVWFRLNRAGLRQRLQTIQSPLLIIPGVLFLCSTVGAATITENFSSDPLQNGWTIFGDANLFQWDSTNHDLAVTWDSSQPNSYFYHSLGTVVTIDDNFSLDFDLNLSQASADGFGSEMAVGFLNLANATNDNFFRTLGVSPNVAEFDYFPPSEIQASIDATFIDESNNFYFAFDTVPLNNGLTYHVHIEHVAGNQTLIGEVFTNGTLYTDLPMTFPEALINFRLDTISISSYQDDGFGDTIFAQGTISNLIVTVPTFPNQTTSEDFSSDPAQNGWTVFGDTNLFQWDSVNHHLAVTWDSAQPNSYFYHSLGTVLAIDDEFSVEFDLSVSNATAEGFGSQLAIGFLNLADATDPGFLRTLGNSPNVAEFDYFPPSQIMPSIDATMIDASTNFYFAFDNLTLDPGIIYHVRITHLANDHQTLIGEVFTNGLLYTALPMMFTNTMIDFRLDTISVSSYQEDGFGDTIFAQGSVGNIIATVPPLPVQNMAGSFTNGLWQVQFADRTNWLFTLQRSQDLASWNDVSATAPGVDGALALSDTNAPADKAFYRVRATRP